VLPVQLTGSPAPAAATGGVRLTTHNGAAEFKDIVVTAGGQTLFQQASAKEGARFGDGSWSNYTLSLKARKTGGEEGFIIAVRDLKPNTRVQWNLGGWKNSKHGIQSELGVQESLIAQVPGHINADRWYGVKIELSGAQMNCFLDGQLVQSAEIALPRYEGVFASAVRDEKSKMIILKVANVHPTPTRMDITLDGVKGIGGEIQVLTLSGAPQDLNSFEEPNKVTPVQKREKIDAPRFQRECAANSFTVLRFKAK